MPQYNANPPVLYNSGLRYRSAAAPKTLKYKMPYPHRSLRTQDFLYIRNFAPDRWPMGSPPFTNSLPAKRKAP